MWALSLALQDGFAKHPGKEMTTWRRHSPVGATIVLQSERRAVPKQWPRQKLPQQKSPQQKSPQQAGPPTAGQQPETGVRGSRYSQSRVPSCSLPARFARRRICSLTTPWRSLAYWLPAIQLAFGQFHIPGPALIPAAFTVYALFRLNDRSAARTATQTVSMPTVQLPTDFCAAASADVRPAITGAHVRRQSATYPGRRRTH
jgi:hypothetical protein